jgi:hypothetical protein
MRQISWRGDKPGTALDAPMRIPDSAGAAGAQMSLMRLR